MTLDHTFRMILIAVFVAVLPVGLYYRIKSQATREKLDRRQEGLFILATLRPVGAVFWLGVFAYMIDPAWIAWAALPLPEWLRWVGAALCIPAVGLLFWTFRTLGPNLTDTVVTRASHTLVIEGPYRWVRHPFYDAMTLWIVAIAFMTANWFLLVTGALIVLLIVVRTRTEEEKLLTRFGDTYQAYRCRTGRFLPRML